MITLYDYQPSGNCYKVRLLLALLGLEFQTISIDFHTTKQHKSDEFLEINPLGQLPVLEDEGVRLRDAQAILVYLAARYDRSGTWYPQDPALIGRIQMWLAFADSLTATISAARLHDTLFHDYDIEKSRSGGHRLLRVLDEHLWSAREDGSQWIATADRPSIADLACFPYVMLSEEGGIAREDYPAIRLWTDRVKQIDGFIEMPGIFKFPALPRHENAPTQ